MSFQSLTSRFLNAAGIGSSIQKSKSPSGWITYAGALNAAATASRLEWGSKPVSDEANGLVVIELHPNIRSSLQFLGYDSADPNNMTATIRGWLVGEHNIRTPTANNTDANKSEGFGVHTFDLALIVGNTVLPSTNSNHPGGTNVAKFVDTITLSVDKTVGGIVVSGDTADCFAEATLDSVSRRFLVLEMACGAGLDGLRVIERQY